MQFRRFNNKDIKHSLALLTGVTRGPLVLINTGVQPESCLVGTDEGMEIFKLNQKRNFFFRYHKTSTICTN